MNKRFRDVEGFSIYYDNDSKFTGAIVGVELAKKLYSTVLPLKVINRMQAKGRDIVDRVFRYGIIKDNLPINVLNSHDPYTLLKNEENKETGLVSNITFPVPSKKNSLKYLTLDLEDGFPEKDFEKRNFLSYLPRGINKGKEDSKVMSMLWTNWLDTLSGLEENRTI
ncbi:MAG: hypothetical protein WDZ62_02490 [Candidatus Pacearchaeota archaeon]